MKEVLNQIKSVVTPMDYWLSNLSNTCAIIHKALKTHWTGFYLVDPKEANKLILGPFQGPLACTQIAKGKGVCGTVFETGVSLVVEDVHQFEGHIACSALSNSELVVPLFDMSGNIKGVFDLDSTDIGFFTKEHQFFIEDVCDHLKEVNNYD
jgi:L-methionine (R)-S-oxide reductase